MNIWWNVFSRQKIHFQSVSNRNNLRPKNAPQMYSLIIAPINGLIPLRIAIFFLFEAYSLFFDRFACTETSTTACTVRTITVTAAQIFSADHTSIRTPHPVQYCTSSSWCHTGTRVRFLAENCPRHSLFDWGERRTSKESSTSSYTHTFYHK